MYAVKFRKAGEKRFFFLDPKGHGVRLKVYASMFKSKEDAQRVVDKNQPFNTEMEFKVVKL